jgi:hypothetical protein
MSDSSIAESMLEDRKHLPSQDRWIKLATLIMLHLRPTTFSPNCSSMAIVPSRTNP